MTEPIVRRRGDAVVLAVAGLLVMTPPARAQAPCLDFEGLLASGGRLEVTLVDPSWIELAVRDDRVYRFAVSAAPETTVELCSSVVDNRSGGAIFVPPIP